MSKRIKESLENTIILDKTEINSKILSSGEYSSDGIYIKKYIIQKDEEKENNKEIKEDSKKYISKINKEGTEYSGILNNQFQREGYGLEKYSNGDIYFGQFESDLRNDKGIYYFNSEKDEENNNIKTECYMGQWKNNIKDEYGIYIWMEEPENNFEYENANFDAYIGKFEEEKYIRGSYITKLNDEFFIYHGNFNKEGKKNDNNAYFYSSKSNKVFHGEIKEDILINGYWGSFDEEKDEVIGILYCVFNEDGTVKDVIEEKDLKITEDEIFDEKKRIENFRSIIKDGDYFGKIYSKFKGIKNKIEKLDDITNILEKEEKFEEIDKILNKFNKKNIYYTIEENFFGNDI